nr:PilC/PilY family type IV pilus protein [uncultured Rhodoferax sp.]
MKKISKPNTAIVWTYKALRRIAVSLLLIAPAWNAAAVNLTPLPPYLAETKGAPMVMLNLSRDHQLFYKAYNEYSDLDGDGAPETQYKHAYRYYGYFDNRRCYTYSTTANRFTPTRKENGPTTASPTYCGNANEWHGNFLNWATMTRMDVVRRILYGGHRSTDNTTTSTTDPSMTVLERAHLPTDAHSFAKYYSGSDIRNLTPFSPGTNEITICNTSFKYGSNRYSHNAISPPSMLVASGNFALWNANERWQCYWSEDKGASNGNVSAQSGIAASANNPSRATNGLGSGSAAGTYTVRVETCKPGLDGAVSPATGFTDDEESRCKFYPLGNYKPVGLLQKYGERNEAAFGLMTGSFNKNISGGVLRKNVASFTDEVDLDDGQFKDVDGIVKNLNKLRIYGYDYDDGGYTSGSVDDCNYQLIGITQGKCGSWGNPMGEIYLESLRYLAGKQAFSDFETSGSKDAAIGLTVAAWSDPFHTDTQAAFGDKLCRRTSVVNFNASVTSYDNDQWSKQTDINGLTSTFTVEALTDEIGRAEGLYATNSLWAIGRGSSSTDETCNAKSISSLSSSTGICPEAPTQGGGFKMAGAAMHAHSTPIRDANTVPSTNKRAYRVDTYGVALSTGTPRIDVPVPGQPGKFVRIIPAYRLFLGAGREGGGTLVDFRIVSQTATSGKYVIQWEDSEQGGDYDQDVWGTLEYNVTGSNIAISTMVIDEATNQPQGFGYAISGTDGEDGVHFHSGIEGFSYNDPTGITVTRTYATNTGKQTTNINASGGCGNCGFVGGDDRAKTTATYTMLGANAETLKDPLWYSAKYGGYDRDKIAGTYVAGTTLPTAAWDSKKTDGSLGSDGIPDNFFYAVDPSQLERSLEQIFSTILKAGGAAPAAATSSRTSAGGYVYVSTHSIKAASTGNDADASGEFLRYSFKADGTIENNADWDAGAKLTTQVENTGWDTNRRVFTMHTSTGPTTFRWSSLSSTQQDVLMKNPITGAAETTTVGQRRLEWLRGNASQETATGLRKRTKTKLGAIINSTPWYVGKPSAGYTNVDFGGGYNTFRTNTNNAARNTLFVAANDGMLHAFNGETGVEQFAYIPRAMYTNTGTAPYTKLSALTDKNYLLNAGIDRVNMDGSVMAADLQVPISTVRTWRTYLFGSFGRGARGIYALDVTDPASVTTENAATAQALVKWEFTEAADPDIGYITGRTNSYNNGQPTQVGYMANGKWAAVYGNGYNSTSGHAALFIFFANGPSSNNPATGWSSGTYIKLNTGSAGQGPDNGLATPTLVDKNNDGVIDTVYAGDLKGNVWKFNVNPEGVTNPDITPSNTALWGVATQASTTDTTKAPLFQATSVLASNGTTVVKQPITTAITTFVHPQGGFQLFFGTGKALESTDYPMSQLFSQSLYGLYDKPGSNIPITTGKTDLVAQTSAVSGDTRYMSTNPVDYSTKKGWYLNLPVASEGVIFNPIAEDSLRVNVRSLAPEATSDGCRYDSSSFGATINPINGNPIPNLLPGVTLITGMGAVGKVEPNTFEYSRGGVFKEPEPPVSTTACVAGSSANCICNPNKTTECVLCPDPNNCKKPWDPSLNQCMYRSIVALGSGGVATSERFGKCTDGRLTWREITRNR